MHRPESAEADFERLLRDKQQEIAEVMAAIAAQEPDIDLKIAAIVEGESEDVKLSIVAHIRDMLRAREEEQAREASLTHNVEAKRVMEAERKSLRMWLTWLMSESTLKKLKLAALIPLLQRQGVRDIGAELAAKGVTLNPSVTDKRELGQLSQMVTQAKEREKDVGRQR